MHRRQHVKCAVTGWTCTVLALQAQAALWEERADPVRQQLKQLQWELRGTHAAVRALEQQVRLNMQHAWPASQRNRKPSTAWLLHTVRNVRGHARMQKLQAEAPSRLGNRTESVCMRHVVRSGQRSDLTGALAPEMSLSRSLTPSLCRSRHDDMQSIRHRYARCLLVWCRASSFRSLEWSMEVRGQAGH